MLKKCKISTHLGSYYFLGLVIHNDEPGSPQWRPVDKSVWGVVINVGDGSTDIVYFKDIQFDLTDL